MDAAAGKRTPHHRRSFLLPAGRARRMKAGIKNGRIGCIPFIGQGRDSGCSQKGIFQRADRISGQRRACRRMVDEAYTVLFA